jgi:hypothetical protein
MAGLVFLEQLEHVNQALWVVAGGGQQGKGGAVGVVVRIFS